MKITNSKFRKTIYYTLLVVSILLILLHAIHYTFIHFSFIKNDVNHLYLIISIVILLLIYRFKRVAYHVDTNGEIISFQLGNALDFTPIKYDFSNKIEFPKYKLHNYKINRYLFGSKLIMYLHSKKIDNHRVKVINTSFFSGHNLKQLDSIFKEITQFNIENPKTKYKTKSND